MPPKRTGNRVSTFLITVNTNNTDQKYIAILKDAWMQIADNLGDYIKHRDPDPEKKYGRWGKYDVDQKRNGLISSTEMKSGVQIAPKKLFIHLHSAIRMVHQSNIQIDTKALKAEMDRLTGLPGVYINVRGVPEQQKTAFENFADYVKRDNV